MAEPFLFMSFLSFYYGSTYFELDVTRTLAPGLPFALPHALAPELDEQRADARDDLIVRRAVRGDQPVAVQNVGRVVDERLAPEVCHAPARFREHGFRRASVPLLRLRREVDVEVCLTLDEQAHLDADRVALHFGADAERAHHRVQARAAVRAARGEPHARKLALVCDAQPLGLQSLPRLRSRAQDPGTLAARGPVENVCGGRVEDAERALAGDRQADLHGEVARARDETLRAVERVDHPHALARQPPRRDNRPLGQDAVFGEGFAERAHDQLVDRAVGLRHRLVELLLVLDAQRLPVKRERRL